MLCFKLFLNTSNLALLVSGNLSVNRNPGANMTGHITASGNIEAALDLYGTNAYIEDNLYHRYNTGTKLRFTQNVLQLHAGSKHIAKLSSQNKCQRRTLLWKMLFIAIFPSNPRC